MFYFMFYAFYIYLFCLFTVFTLNCKGLPSVDLGCGFNIVLYNVNGCVRGKTVQKTPTKTVSRHISRTVWQKEILWTTW